jgi:hypothetical protein
LFGDSDDSDQELVDDDEEKAGGKGVKWGEDVKDFTRKKSISGSAAIGSMGQ